MRDPSRALIISYCLREMEAVPVAMRSTATVSTQNNFWLAFVDMLASLISIGRIASSEECFCR